MFFFEHGDEYQGLVIVEIFYAWWGIVSIANKTVYRIVYPDEVDIFNLPNPSSRTMALRSTQPLTEMSTRNLPEVKERAARKADNLTAICEPIV
jgi:hypothetical protein